MLTLHFSVYSGQARTADLMSQVTYFVQGCPTCGRASQVRVEYLGQLVQCRHCGGEFTAVDDDAATPLDVAASGLGNDDRLEKPR